MNDIVVFLSCFHENFNALIFLTSINSLINAFVNR